MNWSGAAVIRLVLVGLLGGIVQLTTISQLQIFGVAPDLCPLLVASVGLLAGPVTGACFGFSLGLFVDTSLLYMLGVSSLVLAVVGYGAGLWRSLRDPQSAGLVIFLGAVSTVIAVVGFAVVQFLLGVEAPLSWSLLRQAVALTALNAVVAVPVCRLVKKGLGPSLVQESRPRRRRRRTPSSGSVTPMVD